jgi:hypothetical protein
VRAGPFKRTFVLLRAIDVKGKLVVNVHVIELAGRLIVLRAPGLSGIHRNGGAAVVAFEQNLRVVRVDPDHVIIAVRRFQFRECFGAVVRNP